MQLIPRHSSFRVMFSTLSLAALLTLHANAQATSPTAPSGSLIAASSLQDPAPEQATLLPDAPGIAMLSATSAREARAASERNDPPDHHAGPAATNGLGSVTPEASHTQKYIEPGQSAPRLSAGDKTLLGLRDAFSLFSASAWFASAGYEQLLNGSPNYGTDRGAFGQRLGASAVRDITEGVFSDSIMSPLLHEDPRYYRLGPGHNIFARLVYAGTRPLITRTDSGRISPNLALMAGNAGGSALTNVYYPQLNRGVTQTLETFGGSMGGSALGDVVSEFYDDIFHPHRHP
ncbi:MAG TPA: hypothetical protein VGU23_06765 [Acidobacteriaceae bacterium]|nr:hypothetical protein [Acidobacteriaceae bacterium]